MDTNSVAAWASVGSAAFAAVAAIASFIAISANGRIAAEHRASDSVKKYFELAIQNPKLSTDRAAQLHEWFAGLVLITLQDVLMAHRKSAIWSRLWRGQKHWKEDFARNQLKLFAVDLESLADELDDYGPEVSKLAKSVLYANKQMSE